VGAGAVTTGVAAAGAVVPVVDVVVPVAAVAGAAAGKLVAPGADTGAVVGDAEGVVDCCTVCADSR
jgi:hypothetical protein